MSEKFLVTGGAGFIGSNLVDALLAENYEVVCLDNFSTGRIENLTDAMKDPRFTLLKGDIRDASACREAVSGCSGVFHEAALGSVPRSMKDPASTVSVNVTGFVNILKASADSGVKRIVYASSSAVYGNDPTLPKREERIGCALSPYALSKQNDEHYAALFSKLYGLEATALRYFNVFGRRQSPEGEYAAVIPRFVHAALNGGKAVIYGDGSNSRDFTYIDNVLSANMLAMSSKVTDTAFNVACGSGVTLSELFEEIRKACGVPEAEVEFAPSRMGDIPHSLADISKARAHLGYKVLVPFKEGIARTVSYWRGIA